MLMLYPTVEAPVLKEGLSNLERRRKLLRNPTDDSLILCPPRRSFYSPIVTAFSAGDYNAVMFRLRSGAESLFSAPTCPWRGLVVPIILTPRSRQRPPTGLPRAVDMRII